MSRSPTYVADHVVLHFVTTRSPTRAKTGVRRWFRAATAVEPVLPGRAVQPRVLRRGAPSLSRVPRAQPPEPLVQVDRGGPLQHVPGAPLVEPVGGRQLLGEETGERRGVLPSGGRPDAVEARSTGPGECGRDTPRGTRDVGRPANPREDLHNWPWLAVAHHQGF